MTTVRLWSTTAGEYLIIRSAQIELQCEKKPTVEYADPPLTQTDWGTTQTRKMLDLVDYKRTWVITGYIDTEVEYSTSSFSTTVTNADVYTVRDSLSKLMSYGGVIDFTVGTTGDGYSASYSYTGLLTKISYTQPATDEPVANKLKVSLTLEEGANL